MKRTSVIAFGLLVPSTSLEAVEIYNNGGDKLDIYGRVKNEVYLMSDNKDVDGDQTYIRFGFKGRAEINSHLTGFGQWEYQVAASKTEGDTKTAKTRLAFAGLKFGDYGSFDYGRNYGVLYNIGSYTNVMPEFTTQSYAKTDNFMTTRTSGVATYSDNTFFGLVDGLKITFQYQGKNENDGRSASKQNGDGVGTSLTYDISDTGLSVGAGYTKSNRTLEQKNQDFGKGDNAEAWNAGIKYDVNKVYLAAVYAETSNMTPISGTATINGENKNISGFVNRNQAFEIVAQYLFDSGFHPSIGYIYSRGKGIEGVGDTDLISYVDVSATYFFTKKFSTFIEYKINRLSDNNALHLNNDDVLAIGLLYQF